MMIKISNTSKYILAEGICITILSALLMACIVYFRAGALYLSAPDSEVYLSIADNFLQNGHFIQTARVYEPDMVVAPGLPLILTIIKWFCNRIYFVIFIQYICFGMSCWMLQCICKSHTNKYLGYFAVLIYIGCLSYGELSSTPSYILTETWALIILILCAYIANKLYLEGERKRTKRIVALFFLIFMGYLLRPVLLMLYLPWGVFCLWLLYKKQLPIKAILGGMLCAIILLSMNTYVNYREVGEFVVIENYSAEPLYQANNKNTKLISYGSDIGDQFVDSRYYEIKAKSGLSKTERNAEFKKATIHYVSNHIFLTIKNTFIKFIKMFVVLWKYMVMVTGVSLIIMIWRHPDRKFYYLAWFSAYFFIGLATSFGLFIPRYSFLVLPIHVFFNIIFWNELKELIIERFKIID